MPYVFETWNGVSIYFHPLRGQWCLSETFNYLQSAYNLSTVRAMILEKQD